MSSPHRPLNHRSGLVVDTRELGRRAGAMKVVRASVEAPADLGISVVGVPSGSPIELDLRLESVVEGNPQLGMITRLNNFPPEAVACPQNTQDNRVP